MFRCIVKMAYVEGYTHREISELTGLNEKSLKVTLFRIRKKFAAMLKESGFEGVKNGK